MVQVYTNRGGKDFLERKLIQIHKYDVIKKRTNKLSLVNFLPQFSNSEALTAMNQFVKIMEI